MDPELLAIPEECGTKLEFLGCNGEFLDLNSDYSLSDLNDRKHDYSAPEIYSTSVDTRH